MDIRNQHNTTSWSGGTTTELFIYPESSDYKKGDYLFRLSTATVEIEESSFTPLPGVARTLMVLEGEMELIHEGHHHSKLSPLDFDVFEGGWHTQSKGKCVDFNLMCKKGANGELKGFKPSKNEVLELIFDGLMNFLYVFSGTLEIDGKLISTGDFIEFDSNSKNVVTRAQEDSLFVQISLIKL
ncbi:MAG: HutD family protein [Crocinitomicaceae bacterium]